MTTVAFTVEPKPPYDHEHTASHITFHCGRYGADVYEEGNYRRLLDFNGRLVSIDVTWNHNVDDPRLDVSATGDWIADAGISAIKRHVRWLLGAEQDLEPFHKLALADEGLAPVIREFHGLHAPQSPSVFEALVSAILGQQISSHVARILRTLLIETFGSEARDLRRSNAILSHACSPRRGHSRRSSKDQIQSEKGRIRHRYCQRSGIRHS